MPVLENPQGRANIYPTGGVVPCLRLMVWTPEVPPGTHLLVKHGQQFDICFISYYQVPINVTAGWTAFLVNTMCLFIQLGRLEQFG